MNSNKTKLTNEVLPKNEHDVNENPQETRFQNTYFNH